MGSLTLLGIGVLMLVVFGLLYWLAIFTTIRAVLAFVGTVLIGYSGWAGHATQAATLWTARMSDDLTRWALGVSIGGTVLTIVAGVIFVHDLWPKRGARKRTGWAGVALALLLLANVSGIPALNGIVPGIRTGITSVRTIGGK